MIGSDHEFSCVIPIGGNPRELTIDADGSRLYATNYGGSVSVLDIAGVDVIPGVCRARRVDTEDGPLIYGAANALDGGRISVIGAGGATTDTIAAFDGYVITDLAADSDSNRVYVGLSRQSACYQYDTGLVGVIDVGGHPEALAGSADGHCLYVGDHWSGSVTVFSVQP